MTDPLGLINSGAVNPAGQDLPIGANRGIQPQPGAPSFKDVLVENLKEVNSLQQDADKATTDYLTGKRSDIEGVIFATQKADTAFRALQAVRNRVMEAYEERSE